MQRHFAIDVLKLSLAFMVVALHCAFFSDISQTLAYLLNNGLFRIAVPIFFVINGYYFSHALAAPTPWLKRGLILYLLWMGIYSYKWFDFSGVTIESSVQNLSALLNGYGHLWYLAGMLGAAAWLYCVKNLPSPLLLTLSVSLYLLAAAIQYLSSYYSPQNLLMATLLDTTSSYRNSLLFAFPFFCIGYLIAKHQIHEKIKPLYLALGTAAGFLLLLGESYVNLLSMAKPQDIDILCSLIILCPLIFMLCLTIKRQGSSKNIALLATAIYLVHYLVGQQLYTRFAFSASVLTLATLLLSVLISFALIKANQKFKYLL